MINKTVDLWPEPRDLLCMEANFICEMNSSDHAFLCGMIRSKKPRKLLEIGVAEGGTTAVIAKCLSMMGNQCEVYSVDLSERFYHDAQKKTGYEYGRLSSYIDSRNITQHFLLGKTVGDQINTIGSDIDFVVIDTTHILPGEILDFLCVLPYLTPDATVILHDVDLNYIRGINGKRKSIQAASQCIATKMLFSTVTADKYMPVQQDGLFNIAAFTVTNDTMRHVTDLFYLLTTTWTYIPSKEIIQSYRGIYEKHFDRMCLDIFDIAVSNNRKLFWRKEILKFVSDEDIDMYRFPYYEVSSSSKIVLYGAGDIGKSIYKAQKYLKKYDIVAWVDRRYKQLAVEGFNVSNPECLSNVECDYIIIAVEQQTVFKSIYEDIVTHKWDKGKKILGPISQF